MNAKFGKLTNGQIEYAPVSLDTGEGVKMNPSEASYLAAGWKRVVDERPPARDGFMSVVSGWTETDTNLTRVYKQIAMPGQPQGGGTGEGRDSDMPPPPAPAGKRIFSKLKVVVALKAANLWILTKTWIEENGLYDHYLAAQNFAEDNEWFLQGKDEVQRLAGKTDEEIESILSQCVING